MTDENYEARAQAHLASIKRDMKASMEDAVVRAVHKVMAEFEAKSDERLMEDWGPGPHEVHSLPALEQQPAAWVGLTDEEVYLNCPIWLSQEQCKEWVQIIEAKLREKNTGEMTEQQAFEQQPAAREPIPAWIKPNPKCDDACLFQCTKGFAQFPECASQPAAREPLTGGDERRHIICLCPDCTKPASPREPVAWEPLTDSQIMASVGRHWGGEKTSISQSRPVGQQWEQICELVRCVIRERFNTPPAQQEPVAYMSQNNDFYIPDDIVCVSKSKILTPLYTRPQAREPLTDDEIWKFWWSRPEVPEGEDDSMEAEFVAAVRRVLAAHGIGEKK